MIAGLTVSHKIPPRTINQIVNVERCVYRNTLRRDLCVAIMFGAGVLVRSGGRPLGHSSQCMCVFDYGPTANNGVFYGIRCGI